MIRFLLVAALVLVSVSPAVGQQLFSNPLATAASYRAERADLSEAHYRLRYEATRTDNGQPPKVSELVIDVAPDWTLVREGSRMELRDFRLNRRFQIDGDHFISANGSASITFRVMERQNRTYLQQLLTAVGPKAQGMGGDDCDSDAELGLALPTKPSPGKIEFRKEKDRVALVCAGRDMGGYSLGDGAAPPAAFWPTLFDEMTTHPALHKRVKESGHAPALLETSFSMARDAVTKRSWRLIAIETTPTAYPLAETMRNATAEMFDKLVAPGAGKLAADVIAGSAQGGAPTSQSWGEHLTALAQSDGQAAAAMLVVPTYNMFPELAAECTGARRHPVCSFAKNLKTIAQGDPAPMSLLEVAMAEQRGDSDAAITAMQKAQASPHGKDAVLGASFALALLKFDQKAIAKAKAANLPTDIRALQASALMALPYNPAYWTDMGDYYGGGYMWQEGLLFYDVAFSLPMPGAVAANLALKGKREVIGRIHNDFPDAFLLR